MTIILYCKYLQTFLKTYNGGPFMNGGCSKALGASNICRRDVWSVAPRNRKNYNILVKNIKHTNNINFSILFSYIHKWSWHYLHIDWRFIHHHSWMRIHWMHHWWMTWMHRWHLWHLNKIWYNSKKNEKTSILHEQH